jgi:tRNA-dihydrouridine synthase A
MPWKLGVTVTIFSGRLRHNTEGKLREKRADRCSSHFRHGQEIVGQAEQSLAGSVRTFARKSTATGFIEKVSNLDHKFCVAPMMEWTDRHCRYLHRLLSARARLYTEMVTADAVVRGERERLIGFDPFERPVALQLGGSEPARLGEAAAIAADFGYDEINLNVGCPSDRVQSGRFGACLMREPALVGACAAAMRARVNIPVTVKCRLGVDDQDPEESLRAMIAACAGAGVTTFIVHARKAWLDGLSPKENRDVPPLDFALVYRMKRENPALGIVVNGGIANLDEAERHLAHVDGVMLGRAAYRNPALLADADARFFEGPLRAVDDAVELYLVYVERMHGRGVPLNTMTRHLLGLFNGRPGARAFRRHLSENATRPGATAQVLREALEYLSREPARAAA